MESNPAAVTSSASAQTINNESISTITGGAVTSLLSNPKAVNELIIGAIVLTIVVISGIFGYRLIFEKK